jgi:hypothetical protein
MKDAPQMSDLGATWKAMKAILGVARTGLEAVRRLAKR